MHQLSMMHRRSPRRVAAWFTVAIAATLSFASPAAAQSVNYTQGTFNQADWDKVVILKSGGFQEFINTVSAGAAWEIDQSRPTGGSGGDLRVAEINRLFTYDPAVNGALTALSFSFDLFGNSSVGYSTQFFGSFRPVIRQAGVVFSVASTSVVPTLQTFTTHTNSFLPTDNWLAPTVGDLRVPDFSATGGLIEFGWRFDGGGGSCPSVSCVAIFTSAFLDNYSVTARGAGLQPTSTVPEPATWALMAVGLTATLLVSRRRRRVV